MDGLLQDLRYVLRTLVSDDLDGAEAKNVGMSEPELEDLQRSGVFEHLSVAVPASQALSGGDGVELGRTPRV